MTASKTNYYEPKVSGWRGRFRSFKEEVRRAETFRNILEECSKHLMIASSIFLENLKKKSDDELHHDHVQSNHRRHPTDVKKKNEAKMNNLASFFRAINIRVKYSWGIWDDKIKMSKEYYLVFVFFVSVALEGIVNFLSHHFRSFVHSRLEHQHPSRCEPMLS